MRRTLALGFLVVAVPSGLIGFRLWSQEAALRGPSGGSGTVEGDRIAVASRVGARLLAVAVDEGQEVEAGALIATFDCSDPLAMLAEANARVEATRAQAMAAVAQGRAAGSGASASAAASEAAGAQAAAVAAQRDAATRQAGRLADLDDGTSVAAVDQSSASAAALEHQSAAAQASARAARAQVGLARSQADAARAAADAAAEQVVAAEAGAARAQLLVGECELRAPRAGIVETLAFEVGELVPPGAPVAVLVNIAEVTATFYLPNAELGAAAVGGAATIEADAWPDETFAGTVQRVASEAAFTPRNVQTRTDRDRLVYPVEITIPNPDRKLRPGMPVQVTLLGTDR